jgi:hypothetical protein
MYGNTETEQIMTVALRSDDPHHVLEVGGEDGKEVIHTWGTKVKWRVNDEKVETSVARHLPMDETGVIVAPHPQ